MNRGERQWTGAKDSDNSNSFQHSDIANGINIDLLGISDSETIGRVFILKDKPFLHQNDLCLAWIHIEQVHQLLQANWRAFKEYGIYSMFFKTWVTSLV